MQKGLSLSITPSAAAELGRQASFAGSPGAMYLDLLEDTCSEGWLHIRLQPGSSNGVPVARADGITLYAPAEQLALLKGLKPAPQAQHSEPSGGLIKKPPPLKSP